MLDVATRKSKIGKTLDTYEISNKEVSLACGVAIETVSRWRNLDSNGKPQQDISDKHLQQLTMLIKHNANVIIDPSDILEEPEYYINKLRVIGSINEKHQVVLLSKHKKINVNTKYPPDTASIEMIRNANKTYYYIFEQIDRDPASSFVHNTDAVLYDKNEQIIDIARDIRIAGDGDELHYYKMGFQFQFLDDVLKKPNDLFNKNPKYIKEIIKISQVSYFHLVTNIQIVLNK